MRDQQEKYSEIPTQGGEEDPDHAEEGGLEPEHRHHQREEQPDKPAHLHTAGEWLIQFCKSGSGRIRNFFPDPELFVSYLSGSGQNEREDTLKCYL